MERGYLIERAMPPPGYHRRRSGLYVRDQPMAKFANPPGSGQAFASTKSWALTIAGTTVSPAAVYLGPDVVTATGAWANNTGDTDGDLTKQAGSPTYDVPSLLGVGGGDDVGVKSEGVAWWQAGNNDFFDLGTDDFAIFFACLMAEAGDRLINKRDGSNKGFELFANSAVQMGFLLGADALVFNAIGPGVSYGSLMIGTLFCDRSASGAESCQCIINNVAGTALDVSAATGSADSATPLRVKSAITGLNPWENDVYIIALYQQSGWFSGTNSAAWLAAHQDFTARLTGTLPQLAPRGSYVGSVVRSTTRYYTRRHGSEDKLHLAGGGLVAVDEVDNSPGVSIFPVVQNVQQESEDGSAWTNNASTDGDSGTASPIVGGTNWWTLVEDGTSDYHAIYRSGSGAPAQNQKVLHQVLVKDVDASYAVLRPQFVPGTAAVCVRLSDGVITDTGVDGDGVLHAYGALPMGGGVYLVWAVAASSNAAPAANVVAVSSSDDGTLSAGHYDIYSRSATLWWTGAVAAVGHDGPVPYVATAGSPVTVNADQVNLNAGQIPTLRPEFAFRFQFKTEDDISAQSAVNRRTILDISDGGAAADRLTVFIDTDKLLKAEMRATGGSDGDVATTLGCVDGGIVSGIVSVGPSGLKLVGRNHKTGAESWAHDPSASVPDDLDEFRLGRDYGDANYAAGRVWAVEAVPYHLL